MALYRLPQAVDKARGLLPPLRAGVEGGSIMDKTLEGISTDIFELRVLVLAERYKAHPGDWWGAIENNKLLDNILEIVDRMDKRISGAE